MIFIAGNVPSLKNSKVATTKGVFMSKTCRKYLQKIGVKKYGSKGVDEYKTRPNKFRLAANKYFDNCPQPIIVGFHFVRDSKRKFDIINAMQIICDLLTAHGFIEDDNAECLIPLPIKINGGWYSYNKDNPGVYLKIIKESDLAGISF